jgi:hypothetical protein
MKLIAFLLLFAPLVWEVLNDMNGETLKEKKVDVFIRVLMALIAAIAGFFIADKPIIDGLILSLAIHFFFFDYLIHYILMKRGVIENKQHWFEYLGKSYTDDVLRQFDPWTRFIIKAGILVGALIIYFV